MRRGKYPQWIKNSLPIHLVTKAKFLTISRNSIQIRVGFVFFFKFTADMADIVLGPRDKDE